MTLQGLHHITAVTGDLQRNLDFYIGILGLRLAKRTVIQEEPSTYHLFYGDAVGSVGTGFTFFDWPQVGHDRPGTRNVIRTFFAVTDESALNGWRDRFNSLSIPYSQQIDFANRPTLHFADPDGQRLGLVAAGRFADYHHWDANAVTEANAVQALHSVNLGVAEVEPTVRFLTDSFGYQTVKTFQSDAEFEAESVVLNLGDGGIGRELIVTRRTDPKPGFRGIGSIHHVALTTAPADSLEDWHERLVATGLKVTDVIHRHYFDSLYVRIPGGTLFELATAGPGLAIDEDLASLGEHLTLPPFLERQRAEIEAHLKPITVPRPRALEAKTGDSTHVA
jgi:glyoxalase family protein